MHESPDVYPPYPDGGAVCGTHPEVAAVGTCARCGTFVCTLCVGHADESGQYCQVCAPRVSSVRIPWEDEELPMRRKLVDTVRLLATQPARAFGQMSPGSAPRALSFAALAGFFPGVLIGGLMILLFGCLAAVGPADPQGTEQGAAMAVMIGMSFGMPLFTVFSSLLYVVFTFVPYHLAAKLVGGQGSAAESLRAASYVQVLQITTLPFMVLSYIPLIGLVFSLALMGYIFGYISYALYSHAEGHHRLEGARAYFAAGAPTLVFMAMIGAVVMAALAVVLAAPQ